MSHPTHLLRTFTPWRIAAVAIMAMTMTMSLWGHAEAAIGVTVALTDNTAGAQADLDIDIALENDLNHGDTIVITLPAGFVVQDGALTNVSHTLMLPPQSITGNNAARTITITIDTQQQAFLPITISIDPSAEILNPAAPAVGLTIDVDADGVNDPGTSNAFNIVAPAASAAVTGTIQGGANTEANIVAGGGTIIITLSNDTWVAAGGVFDAQRQNIINGIDSGGAEGTGWDAVVKAGLAVTDVVRTSNTVVTVTLPAFAGYNITANETITVTIPATALTGNAQVIAAPTFNILAASVALSGTIQGGANAEADIVTGGGTIILTLTNDTWVAAGATFDAQRQNIINGITSAGAEGTGWNTVVRDTLAVGAVVRTSATVVTVTLPAFGGYNITANETITVTVPATAIASAGALTAAPTFTITSAAPATAVTAVSFAGTSNITGAASTYTVTFTASGSGALAPGGTVTIVMNGFAHANGATAVTLGGAFVGTAAGNVAGGNTLTVTLNGGASLANSATGTIAFATTNPAVGAIAAASLTVATSSDTTVVQSGNGLNIVAAAAPAPIFAPTPVKCPAGNFSATGNTPCEPAPAGTFAAGPGATGYSQCQPGSFSTGGAASCTLAPIGFYAFGFGNTQALACPAGQTTRAPGAEFCTQLNAVSDVSFTSTNYRTGSTGVWTVEFTTSADGALEAGDTVSFRVEGVNFFSIGLSGASMGGDFVTGISRGIPRGVSGALPDTIGFRLPSGASLAGGATGRITFTMPNPSARTIPASAITVWTSVDSTPVAANAGVTITPRADAPKLTTLAVAPSDATSFSDIIPVTLVDGQIAYTVDVPAGKRYLVQGESSGNTLTYYLGSEALPTRLFDPNKAPIKSHAIGSTVAIRVENAAGVTTDYTVTLRTRPVGPPAKLVFITQPAGAVAGVAFTTQPRVAIQDANGQTTSSTDQMHLAIKPGTGTPGATLSCLPSARRVDSLDAVAGIGTFTGCKIDRPGTGYVLVARPGTPLTFQLGVSVADDLGAAPLTVGESEPFNVTGGVPTLATLSLVPNSSSTGFSRIDVPVVSGQLVYEVNVPAFDAATRAPRYNLSATMSDPGAEIRIAAFGQQWAPTSISFQSGETITFTATNSAGTSPTYTVRLRAQARPTLTALALQPLTAAGNIDGNVPFSDYPRANLTGGRTEFTLPVASGRSYGVTAEADSGEITYRRNGIAFDPATTRLSAGDTVTIQVVSTGGTSPTYRLTLGGPATAITNVTISASPLTAGAATTITTTFRSTTALVAADSITVKMTGYTFPVGSVTVTPGTGITGTLAGTVSAGARDTVVIRGGVVTAGTQLTLSFPATNPATAGAIAAAGLTVHTSKDTTPVSSSAGFTIAAAQPLTNAAVSLSNTTPAATGVTATVTFTTPVTIPVGGRIRVTLTGFTWPATPVVALASGAATATSAFAANVLTVTTATAAIPANSTVTLRVAGATLPAAQAAKTDVRMSVSSAAGAVLAETQTGTLVAIAAAQPRLEFVTQPQDSTTGAADINVRVRAVKADGTTDTAFNNQVQLSIQGGGSSFGLGSVTAVNGVATFTRTYNPSRADATWTLRATQISGRAAGVYAPATSDSFRVSALPTLRFTTQPSDGTAGAALTTQPVVTAYKADGTVDTAFTGTVTLTLKADTANGAVLTSTATAAVAGRATFAGVSVNNAGTDYVLVASATGYAAVSSDPFNITGAATQIVITRYPSTFAVGRDYTIEVRAEARDANGRAVPGVANQLGLLLNGNNATNRLATTPTRVEDGVAIFVVAPHRFLSGGNYRWGVDHVGGSRNLPQADTAAFTVAKPASKLAFVVQPGGFGSTLGTQPVVEIQDEDGNRVPGATNEVTLTFVATNDTDPIMTGGARRAAVAGQVKYTAVGFTGGTARPGATFTITASAAGLTSATSASFGPAGPTTKLAFTSDLPCGLVARPGCSPAAREGQQFTITVAAQDASGQVNTNENGLATLTGDGNSGMTAKSAPFVNGVATFTGVKFTSASTTGYTLTATAGALTVSSGKIVVTQDNTPASLRFIAAPTHEVTGVNFVTQPVVEVYNAAGRRITDVSGNIVLRLRKQDGTTTSLLEGTASSATGSGVARFPGLKVTGADTNLYLSATLEGTTLEATQTGTFRVYADAASATTARASERTQSKPLSLTFNLACTGSDCQAAVKNDICTALKLDVANCTRVSVTSVSSSSIVIEITDASLITTANVEVIDGQEIITLGGLDLVAFQVEFGAGAPAGTSTLYAVGRIAYDEYGNRLEELSAPQSFSLPVPESVLLPGARPGDLKVAWWDGEQWVQVPTRAVVEEDGSFRVTATTSHLGAFAVLYAPGASRIDTSGVFSASGVGSGVFVGGSTAALAHAASLNDATTLWVQDASGTFRVLVIGGPAFLAEQFASHFADGFAGPTPVTLVRTSASTVTSGASGTASTPTSSGTASTPTSSATASATTHTVAPGDTLSRIGARYGVEWMRIAEANGITGPNYAIRDGLVLAIPA